MKFNLITLAFLALIAAGCASKSVTKSSNAQKELEDKYASKVGTATKQDFVTEFGTPNWCRQKPTGEESCRFYKKTGTKWTGETTDRQSRETFEEVFADFDSNGTLTSFKMNVQK